MTTYLASLQGALHDSFARDPSVIFLGEDVLDPYGGAFKVSQGLSDAYKDRVLTTPISEGAIAGVAAGLALRGMKPVAEIMFGDFLTLCADQIVNHIAKFRAMYGKTLPIPLVIRTPMGGGRGYGATHSQSIEKLFLGIPGLGIVAPSHAHDPGRLLAHAILADDRPILFIENKLLYPATLATEEADLAVAHVDEIPGYPTAMVRNFEDGDPDATVIAYGGASRIILPLLKSLAEEEIRLLAVFPSSLAPVPVETLADAAEQSGRVVIAEEGTAGFNWGSEIAALLHERCWGKLQAPIRRVASAASVIPAASEAENRMLLNASQIEDAILEILA